MRVSKATERSSTMVGTSMGVGAPTQRYKRATRACEICHSRKVRCDADMLGVPCTNCSAFGFECRVPETRRRKSRKDSDERAYAKGNGSAGSAVDDNGLAPGHPYLANVSQTPSLDSANIGCNPIKKHNIPNQNDLDMYVPSQPPSLTGLTPVSQIDKSDDPSLRETSPLSGTNMANYVRGTLESMKLKDNSTVDVFLGDSSHVPSVLKNSYIGDIDTTHFRSKQFKELFLAPRAANPLLSEDYEILKSFGAFLVPPKDICDDLVASYFEHVHPYLPCINRTEFMRRYNDDSNPPSLLLLHCIFMAGSRYCRNPRLLDPKTGTAFPTTRTFLRRAKALFDAAFESDKVVLIQAALLLGFWFEGPEDVNKNVYFWVGIAIRMAEGIGMHRSVERTSMTLEKKRLWRRIWWCCFVRDRLVSVAQGRPLGINTDDTDVSMLTKDDFIEDGGPEPNRVHMLYFINVIKLCEIMGVVLTRQYTTASKFRQRTDLDLNYCDMALASWFTSLPPELKYGYDANSLERSASKPDKWVAILHLFYYTTLTLLHRKHLERKITSNFGHKSVTYPSRTVAFTAAAMITRIFDDLLLTNQVEDLTSFW